MALSTVLLPERECVVLCVGWIGEPARVCGGAIHQRIPIRTPTESLEFHDQLRAVSECCHPAHARALPTPDDGVVVHCSPLSFSSAPSSFAAAAFVPRAYSSVTASVRCPTRSLTTTAGTPASSRCVTIEDRKSVV